MLKLSENLTGIELKKFGTKNHECRTKAAEKHSLLCSLFGYSRQGLYKAQQKLQQYCYKEELVVQQIHQYRKYQKRLGGRKLHFLLAPL